MSQINNVPKDAHRYEIIQPAKNTGVVFYTSKDPGSYVPKHWHHAIEIIYLQEGSLSVAFENTLTTLLPGDCMIINSEVIHSTKCTTYNKAIVFQIPFEFFEQYLPDIEQLYFSLDIDSQNPVQRTKLDIFKKTLTDMQIANDIQPKGYILRFNSLLFEIMYQLYHNFSTQIFHAKNPQKNKDMERLNRILEYTASHYNRPISIQEIADHVYLQNRYFCRFFKKCMGITFLEYQNELRLSYIYQDIITTSDPIHTILERHGFTNYKLFRRMFYEHFDATPTQIRNQHEPAPITQNIENTR